MVTRDLNLDRLNPQQRLAVETLDGIYQVCSVAGSGKTEVLTKRVGYMIGEHGIFPDEILLLTFSKAAAEEMKSRMKKILRPSMVEDIAIGTFHSLGFRILRREYTKMRHPLAPAFAYNEDGKLLNGLGQKILIESIMKDDLNMNLNSKDTLRAVDVIKAISTAKNELIDFKQYLLQCMTEKDFQIAEIYRIYEAKKDESVVIDFDDMVFKLYKLFIENPKILKIYQNKFKYLLVDESQDNNYIQYQLIKMLAAPHNNIFLVGDDDQSMYRFRGARPDEFVNFNTTYQNVQIINLERNYRSIPGILEIANNLIEKNTVRLVKKLMAFLQPSEKKDSITYQVASNMDVEATMVTKKINDSIKDGYKYNDNAIIYRVNSQSMALENELIREGIPYVIYGGTSFYERKEIKDVIAYLKLSHNPHDNEAFERVVNTPNRYLGKAFMNLLKIEAKKRGSSLYDALKTVKLSSMQHRNAMEYYNIIKSINSFAKYHKPERLLEEIIKQTKYDEFISKETAAEEDNDALDNIDILKSALEKYNLVEEFVEFHKKLSGKRRQTDAVKLMTIHKAKGLEFPIVHAVGQSEGLCPNHYAIDSQDPMSIEEERRLAYVLYTRAQKELHNYTPLQFGKNELLPSRFIAESGIDKFAG